MEPTTFGFVGVGRMGALMSARLLEAGHKVCVFDVSREAVEAVKQKGAQALGSAAEVANNAEDVFLSLPNPEIVREACMPGYDPSRAPIDSSPFASFHASGIRLNWPFS